MGSHVRKCEQRLVFLQEDSYGAVCKSRHSKFRNLPTHPPLDHSVVKLMDQPTSVRHGKLKMCSGVPNNIRESANDPLIMLTGCFGLNPSNVFHYMPLWE